MIQRDAASETGLREMIEYVHTHIGHPLIMCEVGCFQGESTAIFASYDFIKGIYCIDPLDLKAIPDDPESQAHPELFEGLYERFIDSTQAERGKINLIRKTSQNAVRQYPSNWFDMVYLDASHQYLNICHDIDQWKRTVTSDGYLCGHDYIGHREVYDAVNRRLGRPEAVFFDTSWIIKRFW
jgi:hypothetical protein